MSPPAPRVLLVTSVGASPAAVTPVLAALEATGLSVRAIDVGRVGSRDEGTLERVIRALVGELAERRLLRELGTYPPDVVVAFDPGTTSALTVARDQATKPAPVIAVIDTLAPEREWATTDADRYLVVDEEAAVALTDHGVESERVLAVGAVAEAAFAQAASESRSALRSRFKLSGVVVVVEVAGLGYDVTSQIALQLSLAEANPTYLFDAGQDSEAATALRRQVPTLGMRAKLFGDTDDTALYWRCADVVIARPRAETVARTLVLGTRLVALLPEDRTGQELASALEARGRAAQANNALLLTSALEQLLKRTTAGGDLASADGAANVADIAWVVGSERAAVIDERHSAAREATRARVRAATAAAAAAERVSATAGGLEDLSGGVASDFAAAADIPDPGEIARLRAEVNTRIGQVSKTVFAAREAAEQWDARHAKAVKKGDSELARDAERNADSERARMHQSLAELSQLQSELKDLDRAAAAAAMGPSPAAARPVEPPPRRPTGPSVDDLLEKMKRQQSGGTSTNTAPRDAKPRGKKPKTDKTVEDELAALKRKMAAKKRKGS